MHCWKWCWQRQKRIWCWRRYQTQCQGRFSFWLLICRAFLLVELYYKLSLIIGQALLLAGLSYWSSFSIGRAFLLAELSYWSSFSIGRALLLAEPCLAKTGESLILPRMKSVLLMINLNLIVNQLVIPSLTSRGHWTLSQSNLILPMVFLFVTMVKHWSFRTWLRFGMVKSPAGQSTQLARKNFPPSWKFSKFHISLQRHKDHLILLKGILSGSFSIT